MGTNIWGQTPQILNTTEGTVLSNSKGDRPLMNGDRPLIFEENVLNHVKI